MSYITDNFHNWTASKEEYMNGRVAIEYVNTIDGEPECTATINLPDEQIEDDEVIIKDYSENEGLYDMMLQAGHIGPAIRYVQSGWISAPVCKLLI